MMIDSANVTSTLSTAHREVSHHVHHTASFQELESGQKAEADNTGIGPVSGGTSDNNAAIANWLNMEECKPAEQSVSFDEVKMRNKRAAQ